MGVARTPRAAVVNVGEEKAWDGFFIFIRLSFHHSLLTPS